MNKRWGSMKRFLTITLLVLIVLAACGTGNVGPNDKTDTNYYLSFSEESDHWKLQGYEIMFTSNEYNAGNGITKNEKQR